MGSGLTPSDTQRINEDFYRGYLWDYFSDRLTLLGLVYEKQADVAALLGSGVTVGDVGLPHWDSCDDLWITLHVEMLGLHYHLCEVLFSTFWVHAVNEECPPLALQQMRVKGRAASAADYLGNKRPWDESEDIDMHARTVLTPETRDSASPGQVEALASLARTWLMYAAHKVTQGVPGSYNALKHGLNLQSAMKDAPRAWVSGSSLRASLKTPGVVYLMRESGTGEWFRVFEQVHFERLMQVCSGMNVILPNILVTAARLRGFDIPRKPPAVDRAGVPPRIQEEMTRWTTQPLGD